MPGRVQYGALLEEWRDHAWTGGRRPLKLRALLWAVTGAGACGSWGCRAATRAAAAGGETEPA